MHFILRNKEAEGAKKERIRNSHYATEILFYVATVRNKEKF